MSTTDDIPVRESKTRERVMNAQLAYSRAKNHVLVYPAAQATPLIRDLQTALAGLIAEIERR